MVEGRSGAEGDEGLGCGCTDWDREGTETRNVGEFDRKRGVREREGGAGESLKIVNRFDDMRIKWDDLFRLTLMEVGEVNGGRTRCPGSAEGSQECILKGIPVSVSKILEFSLPR